MFISPELEFIAYTLMDCLRQTQKKKHKQYEISRAGRLLLPEPEPIYLPCSRSLPWPANVIYPLLSCNVIKFISVSTINYCDIIWPNNLGSS